MQVTSDVYEQILAVVAREATVRELAEVISDLKTCEAIIDALRTLAAPGGGDA